jgi:hypothetical protein
MLDIGRDVEPRSARSAFRAQLEQPILLIIPITLAISLFLLDHLTGIEAPDARDLAKSFAFPPLDTYSDLRFLGDENARWVVPIALALRIAAVYFFLTSLFAIPWTLSRLARLAGVYVLATASFSIQFGLSALYVNMFGRLVTTGESSPVPLILLFISPVVHGLLALVLVQLAVKAVHPNEVSLTFKDPVLWILAGLSTWIWFMVASRVDALFETSPTLAFGLGFAAILVQSTLYCATALRLRR